MQQSSLMKTLLLLIAFLLASASASLLDRKSFVEIIQDHQNSGDVFVHLNDNYFEKSFKLPQHFNLTFPLYKSFIEKHLNLLTRYPTNKDIKNMIFTSIELLSNELKNPGFVESEERLEILEFIFLLEFDHPPFLVLLNTIYDNMKDYLDSHIELKVRLTIKLFLKNPSLFVANLKETLNLFAENIELFGENINFSDIFNIHDKNYAPLVALGYLLSQPDEPQVVDSCSRLFTDYLKGKGVHAQSIFAMIVMILKDENLLKIKVLKNIVVNHFELLVKPADEKTSERIYVYMYCLLTLMETGYNFEDVNRERKVIFEKLMSEKVPILTKQKIKKFKELLDLDIEEKISGVLKFYQKNHLSENHAGPAFLVILSMKILNNEIVEFLDSKYEYYDMLSKYHNRLTIFMIEAYRNMPKKKINYKVFQTYLENSFILPKKEESDFVDPNLFKAYEKNRLKNWFFDLLPSFWPKVPESEFVNREMYQHYKKLYIQQREMFFELTCHFLRKNLDVKVDVDFMKRIDEFRSIKVSSSSYIKASVPLDSVLNFIFDSGVDPKRLVDHIAFVLRSISHKRLSDVAKLVKFVYNYDLDEDIKDLVFEADNKKWSPAFRLQFMYLRKEDADKVIKVLEEVKADKNFLECNRVPQKLLYLWGKEDREKVRDLLKDLDGSLIKRFKEKVSAKFMGLRDKVKYLGLIEYLSLRGLLFQALILNDEGFEETGLFKEYVEEDDSQEKRDRFIENFKFSLEFMKNFFYKVSVSKKSMKKILTSTMAFALDRKPNVFILLALMKDNLTQQDMDFFLDTALKTEKPDRIELVLTLIHEGGYELKNQPANEYITNHLNSQSLNFEDFCSRHPHYRAMYEVLRNFVRSILNQNIVTRRVFLVNKQLPKYIPLYSLEQAHKRALKIILVTLTNIPIFGQYATKIIQMLKNGLTGKSLMDLLIGSDDIISGFGIVKLIIEIILLNAPEDVSKNILKHSVKKFNKGFQLFAINNFPIINIKQNKFLELLNNELKNKSFLQMYKILLQHKNQFVFRIEVLELIKAIHEHSYFTFVRALFAYFSHQEPQIDEKNFILKKLIHYYKNGAIEYDRFEKFIIYYMVFKLNADSSIHFVHRGVKAVGKKIGKLNFVDKHLLPSKPLADGFLFFEGNYSLYYHLVVMFGFKHPLCVFVQSIFAELKLDDSLAEHRQWKLVPRVHLFTSISSIAPFHVETQTQIETLYSKFQNHPRLVFSDRPIENPPTLTTRDTEIYGVTIPLCENVDGALDPFL